MNIFQRMILATIGLILTAVLLRSWSFVYAEPPQVKIAVLTSHNAPPYEEALEGFKRFFVREGMQPIFEVYPLDGDGVLGARAMGKAKEKGANLFFTLGSLATTAAMRESGELPTIAGLVLDSDEIKKKGNITGVVLDFPLETQFQWMQRILPDSGGIGVVHSPKNLEKIKSAEKMAQSLGLKFYSRKVETPSDIPDALEYLAKHADVLWGVPDELVFTSQTAKQILLISFRNRIPLVGISSAWVKAGALYSLDWDYADMGSQCAEMAFKVLKGAKSKAIPTTGPRKVIYSLNLKTALHMKIDLPEALIEGAHQVYR